MTTTVVEAIKYAMAEGLKTVNLSVGQDVSKTRWGPEEINYYECFEASSKPISAWLLSLYGKHSLSKGSGCYTCKLARAISNP